MDETTVVVTAAVVARANNDGALCPEHGRLPDGQDLSCATCVGGCP